MTIYECEECEFCGSLESTRRHALLAHGNSKPRLYRCPVCELRFGMRKVMRMHCVRNHKLLLSRTSTDLVYFARAPLFGRVENFALLSLNFFYCFKIQRRQLYKWQLRDICTVFSRSRLFFLNFAIYFVVGITLNAYFPIFISFYHNNFILVLQNNFSHFTLNRVKCELQIFALGGIRIYDSCLRVYDKRFTAKPQGPHDRDRSTQRVILKYIEGIFSTKALAKNHLA